MILLPKVGSKAKLLDFIHAKYKPIYFSFYEGRQKCLLGDLQSYFKTILEFSSYPMCDLISFSPKNFKAQRKIKIQIQLNFGSCLFYCSFFFLNYFFLCSFLFLKDAMKLLKYISSWPRQMRISLLSRKYISLADHHLNNSNTAENGETIW